jgi:hypothetical protein
VRDQKRKACPVCALPDVVRQQLAAASDKGIKIALQVEWLRSEHQAKVTPSDLTTHRAGRHDAED